jgi:mRNA-degrading endonuclease HigB of HigAB toxin-antitoxin module
MNIIKRPTVEYYQRVFPEAETALEDWYDQFKRTNLKHHKNLSQFMATQA